MLKDYLKPILTDAFGVVSALFFCLSFLSTSIFTGSSLDSSSSSSSSSSPLSPSSEISNKRNLGWILVSVIIFYMYMYTVNATKETPNYTQRIIMYIYCTFKSIHDLTTNNMLFKNCCILPSDSNLLHVL